MADLCVKRQFLSLRRGVPRLVRVIASFLDLKPTSRTLAGLSGWGKNTKYVAMIGFTVVKAKGDLLGVRLLIGVRLL